MSRYDGPAIEKGTRFAIIDRGTVVDAMARKTVTPDMIREADAIARRHIREDGATCIYVLAAQGSLSLSAVPSTLMPHPGTLIEAPSIVISQEMLDDQVANIRARLPQESAPNTSRGFRAALKRRFPGLFLP